MDATRLLLVTADDFGIGPETSRGILGLAARGVVTATVLLVNSPYAEASVGAWRAAGEPVELGWHPCLTLDRPVAPPGKVPSLVDVDGRFRPLGRFLRRLLGGRVRRADVEAELRAQLGRFRDLVGRAPGIVNTHQHLALFPPVGAVLDGLLRPAARPPYVRRVREPWATLAVVPGGRVKRVALNALGRRHARGLARAGFPGADWLAGVADAASAADPEFFARWLRRVPGRVVELMCHPGHPDPTLDGRDGSAEDGLLRRRVDEMRLLSDPGFDEACRRGGFVRVRPSDLTALSDRGEADVA